MLTFSEFQCCQVLFIIIELPNRSTISCFLAISVVQNPDLQPGIGLAMTAPPVRYHDLVTCPDKFGKFKAFFLVLHDQNPYNLTIISGFLV